MAMLTASVAATLLDTTKQCLRASSGKDVSKEILTIFVADIVTKCKLHESNAEEVRGLLDQCRPLVYGMSLRFDLIIKAGFQRAEYDHKRDVQRTLSSILNSQQSESSQNSQPPSPPRHWIHDRQPDSTQIWEAETLPAQLNQPAAMPDQQYQQSVPGTNTEAGGHMNPALDPLIQQYWNMMMCNISSDHPQGVLIHLRHLMAKGVVIPCEFSKQLNAWLERHGAQSPLLTTPQPSTQGPIRAPIAAEVAADVSLAPNPELQLGAGGAKPPSDLFDLPDFDHEHYDMEGDSPHIAILRKLKPLPDKRAPGVKDVLHLAWKTGFYTSKDQLVPLLVPVTVGKKSKKKKLGMGEAAGKKLKQILIGVTIRHPEGGGAAACYVSKSKVVVTGRDSKVRNDIMAWIAPFTTEFTPQNVAATWDLPSPADFNGQS